MKVNQDQLQRHLQQNLAPVYLISGDEPLLIQESCQMIRDNARNAGFSNRERYYVESGFDWQDVLMSANSLSLFADRKLIDLSFKNGKFTATDSDAMLQLLELAGDETLVLISMPKLEGATFRNKAFKAIEQKGVTVPVWPIDRQRLPQWIQSRLKQHGLDASNEAIAFLADNVEGNLLAANQEIDKLALTCDSKTIDLETMARMISNASRYTVFNYLDKCLAGDTGAALKTLHGLHAEGTEPPILVWGISRELRMLLRLHHAVSRGENTAQAIRSERVPRMRERLVENAMRRLPVDTLYPLLEKARRIDRSIKGMADDSPWLLLEQLTLSFCRPA